MNEIAQSSPSKDDCNIAMLAHLLGIFTGFVGALIIWLWEMAGRRSADKYAIPLASGLIAGESLIKAIIAMTATAVGLWGSGAATH